MEAVRDAEISCSEFILFVCAFDLLPEPRQNHIISPRAYWNRVRKVDTFRFGQVRFAMVVAPPIV